MKKSKIYGISYDGKVICLSSDKKLLEERLEVMQIEYDKYDDHWGEIHQQCLDYLDRHPEILKDNYKDYKDVAARTLLLYVQMKPFFGDYGSETIDFSKVVEEFPKLSMEEPYNPEECEITEFELLERE